MIQVCKSWSINVISQRGWDFTWTKSGMVLSPLMTILLWTSRARMCSAPVQPSTISSIRTPSCRCGWMDKNEKEFKYTTFSSVQINKACFFCCFGYIQQTAAGCLPCWCASGCPDEPWQAVGPVVGWLPAPWEHYGWLDIEPGCESNQLWPRKGEKWIHI